jgi:hypothetical protein
LSRVFILALCLMLAACDGASSPPENGSAIPFAQKKTGGGFELAYYLSFLFDSCGDRTTGQIYREAVRAKANACVMPSEARAAFARTSAHIDETMPLKIEAYHREHGDHPATTGDYQCSRVLDSAEAVKQRSVLAQWKNGQTSLDSAMPGSCETGIDEPFAW